GPMYLVMFITGASSSGSGSSDASAGLSILSLITLLYAIGMGFFQLYKEGSTGQTIGKKALGISVLREADGRTLGFGFAFVRKLAHFLDSIACYLGFLWPLWDQKKQTFADKVCNTVVIKVK
ncbi:RDD family protein, partial [Streptomyces goshikiensis]